MFFLDGFNFWLGLKGVSSDFDAAASCRWCFMLIHGVEWGLDGLHCFFSCLMMLRCRDRTFKKKEKTRLLSSCWLHVPITLMRLDSSSEAVTARDGSAHEG